MPVDNYLVLYIPNQDTCRVDIVRVIDGGRYIEKQLNQQLQKCRLYD